MADYTIKKLAQKFGHSEVYIRRSITQGKLKTTKEKIAKNTYRHIISEADYKLWRNSTVSRSKRTDNRNKGIIYLHRKTEYAKLQNFLEVEMPEVAKSFKWANIKNK